MASAAGRGPAHRVGIRDVADAAGVSITAVSYALNGTGRLAEATRTRIQEVAARLGYHPSARGRLLAGGHSKLFVGVASFDRQPGYDYLNDPALSTLYLAGARWFSSRGYALAVVPAANLDLLDTIPTDGLILLDRWVDDGLDQLVERLGVPSISVTTAERPATLLTVANDEAAMFGDAVAHLVARGSRRPGLLLAPEGLIAVRNGLTGALERARALGVEPVVVHAGNSPEETARGVGELLEAGVDGVWAQVGAIEHLVHALEDCGVPHDRVLLTSEMAPGWADGSPVSYVQPGVLGIVLAGGDLLIDTVEGRREGPERVTVPHTLHAVG